MEFIIDEARQVIDKYIKDLHFKEFLNNEIKEPLKVSLIDDNAPDDLKESYTASWKYSKGYHEIIINPFAVSNIAPQSIMKQQYGETGSRPYILIKKDNNGYNVIPKEVYLSYIEKYFYHELAHSFYTEKDLNKITEILNKENIPFKIFNIFEDARIEELYRKNFNYKFNWVEFEFLSKKEIHIQMEKENIPEINIFSYFIQNEGVFKVDKKYDEVVTFYNRTIKAKNSYEVLDICKEWLQRFPDSENSKVSHFIDFTPAPRQNINYDSDLDIENSNKIFGYTIQVVGDVGKNQDESEPIPYEQAKLNHYNEGEISLILQGNDVIDEKRVMKNAKIFERILKQSSKYSTIIPQKKLNIRNFISGKQNFFVSKTDCKGIKKQKTFSLIFDCSGSMRGFPLEEGKILISILNNLAKENIVNGNIILTGTDEYKNGITSIHKLPMKDDIISKISAYAGEGFATTFTNVAPELKKSDYVFVYTDGCITDKPNRDYAKKQGIFTYGLYAGEKNMTEELVKYFDCGISRNTVEELIYLLIKKVRNN